MNDTIYSGTVTDFRRDLTAQAEMFRRSVDIDRPDFIASLMAANYAYTLAAVLGMTEREFGHEAAARLAAKADDILTNGDEADLNADVGASGYDGTVRPCGCLSFGEACDKCRIDPETPAVAEALRA